MTVINFEKDSEADNPHMQISPHMFCAACALDTDILYEKQCYFHNSLMAAILNCNALWGVQGLKPVNR